jgi:ABC-2 type transport system permease protein
VTTPAPSSWTVARTVANNNWVRASKDRRAPLTIVVLPILIMLVVGTVFGVDDRTQVGLVDHDGGRRAVQLRHLIEDTGSLRLRTYTSEDRMRSDLRRLRVLAGMVIPRGYTRQLDEGDSATVDTVSQPGRGESIIARAELARVVARQGADVLAQRVTGRSTISERRNAQTVTRYGPANSDVSPFSYTAPSNLVLFVFLTSLVFGSGLVFSRQTGVLRRMLAAPVQARAIVAGQAVTAFVVALVQAVGLFAMGAVFFGVDWGDPAADVLMVLVLALAAAGLNMLKG